MTRLALSLTLSFHFARLARVRTTRGTSRRRHS
jgi:hypothetical protein